jgi:hypothetical protein
MRTPDIIRYGLWCGVAVTAAGNRREYRMMTTWLPHLAMNTISLLLPDACQLLLASGRPRLSAYRAERSPRPRGRDVLSATFAAIVRDNPGYVLYVAPLAASYLLSAPWLNIYKGALAEKRLAGFGLDALPHALTALALTALVRDTAGQFAELAARAGALEQVAYWAARHRTSLSALVLALATLLWEYGEYKIHFHELSRRGAAEQINMQWSVADTVSDCLANVIGWLLATAWRSRQLS